MDNEDQILAELNQSPSIEEPLRTVIEESTYFSEFVLTDLETLFSSKKDILVDDVVTTYQITSEKVNASHWGSKDVFMIDLGGRSSVEVFLISSAHPDFSLFATPDSNVYLQKDKSDWLPDAESVDELKSIYRKDAINRILRDGKNLTLQGIAIGLSLLNEKASGFRIHTNEVKGS